jgi:hypothetical protein
MAAGGVMATRRSKIRKTAFCGIWAATPLVIAGSILLYRQAGGWGVAAWVAYAMIGVALVIPHKRRRRRRSVKRVASRDTRRTTTQRKPLDLGLTGDLLPWAGPAQRRPQVITAEDMARWSADERAELELERVEDDAIEHGETESGIEYNVYPAELYAQRRRDEGLR